jgi:hypothetical protein
MMTLPTADNAQVQPHLVPLEIAIQKLSSGGFQVSPFVAHVFRLSFLSALPAVESSPLDLSPTRRSWEDCDPSRPR